MLEPGEASFDAIAFAIELFIVGALLCAVGFSAKTHDERTVRMLNLIDEHTRVSLLVRPERRWSSAKVIEVLADDPIEEWQNVISINLLGVFYCCRSILPHRLRQGYGRIVNVASIAGKKGNANASAYSASNAGVIALTKSLGKETADKNITVNCITPSAARTRIFEQMTKEHIAFMLSRIPRGRFLEVGAMVAWLVSEDLLSQPLPYSI